MMGTSSCRLYHPQKKWDMLRCGLIMYQMYLYACVRLAGIRQRTEAVTKSKAHVNGQVPVCILYK